MARHEVVCVHNPKRVCWACQEFSLDPEPLENLIPLAFAITREDQDLGPLQKSANGCPACMLAAIVQARKIFTDPEDAVWVKFDYKARMQEKYGEHNREFRDMVMGLEG
jgi:hypothetical protein